ncbi:33549_t:CDS:2, partial [Racocetra persica]
YEPMYEEKHKPIHEEEHEPMYEKAYEPELQLDESEVSESSQVQKSNSSNSIHTRSFVWKYFKKKRRKPAIFEICNQKLAYQYGMTSNLKSHLNSHKTKVPKLKKLNVKEDISVVDMLNNKSG